MRLIKFLPAAALFLLAARAHADIPLPPGSTVAFATPEQAREVLTKKDEFVAAMSAFDRAGRVKSDQPVTEAQYLEHAGKAALPWSEPEKAKLTKIITELTPKLAELNLAFPKNILLIKTNGTEEGNSSYTRANAIILPQADVAANEVLLKEYIAKSLFHIYTRANPQRAEPLRAIIGFVKCNELPMPDAIKDQTLANPDDPLHNYCINVFVDGKAAWVMPLLASRTPAYNRAQGEFHTTLILQFAVLDRDETTGKVTSRLKDGKPEIAAAGQIGGYVQKVLKNSNAAPSPQEVLADNFKLLLLDPTKATAPQVLTQFRDILTKKP